MTDATRPAAAATGPRRRSPAEDGAGRARAQGISLLAIDADFGQGLPPDERLAAQRQAVIPRVEVTRGAWSPPERSAWPAPVTGLILARGLLARSVSLAGRASTQLLGPGDIFCPWPVEGEHAPGVVSWKVHDPVVAGVLDARFAVAARRWPPIAAVAQQRLCTGNDRLASHLAIAQLPSVEERLLAYFEYLASRFGRVAADGLVLDLPLTHTELGQLVGARRPTVSLALTQLVGRGRLKRREDHAWVVVDPGQSPADHGVPGPA